MLTLENNQLQKKNESLRVKQNKYNFLNTELAKLEKQMNAQNAETPKNNKTIAKKQKPAKTKLVKQPQQPNLKEMITEETPFMISSENENVEV